MGHQILNRISRIFNSKTPVESTEASPCSSRVGSQDDLFQTFDTKKKKRWTFSSIKHHSIRHATVKEWFSIQEIFPRKEQFDDEKVEILSESDMSDQSSLATCHLEPLLPLESQKPCLAGLVRDVLGDAFSIADHEFFHEL